ncbi:DUF962 domain-containing protein [Paraphysoderma sedebokerense]|nr:DUF962 domain-containing protein [Paraphysoderma sedebokerense]
MGLFNLLEQMTFYGSYHNNKLNQLVHIIFVPLIYWTALVWASNTGPLIDTKIEIPIPSSLAVLNQVFGGNTINIIPNLAFFASCFYTGYYFLLEPVATILYFPILAFEYFYATHFLLTVPNANWIALYLHVSSWVAQIAAHKVFEGRSPALLDNLAQALILAPLFVFLEVLFMFGYRPALHKELKSKVGVAILDFKKQQKQKNK